MAKIELTKNEVHELLGFIAVKGVDCGTPGILEKIQKKLEKGSKRYKGDEE